MNLVSSTYMAATADQAIFRIIFPLRVNFNSILCLIDGKSFQWLAKACISLRILSSWEKYCVDSTVHIQCFC